MQEQHEDERYGVNGDDLEAAERASKRHRVSAKREKDEQQPSASAD